MAFPSNPTDGQLYTNALGKKFRYVLADNKWQDVTMSATYGHTHNGTDSPKVDHEDLDNKGTHTHTEIDTHIDDTTIHFTKGNIAHSEINDDEPEKHRLINDAGPPSATELYSSLKTDQTFVKKAGDTMTGPLDMGANKITSSYAPQDPNDLTNKSYVDALANGVSWQDQVINEIDFTTNEPTSPTTGDRYINTTTGTSNQTATSVVAHDILEWNGTGWDSFTPDEGWALYNETTDKYRMFNGTLWVNFGSAISHDSLLDVSANDHHNQVHDIDGSDHTGTLSWSKVDKTGSKVSDLGDVEVGPPLDGEIMVYNNTAGEWQFQTPASSGEANTASNVGTAGVGLFKQKTGVDLEFHKLEGGFLISTSYNATNDTVEIDFDFASHTLQQHVNMNAGKEQIVVNVDGKGATFPSSPVNGQVFYHTGDEEWYRFNTDASASGSWVNI